MSNRTGSSIIMVLLACGTVGALSPQMFPRWEFSGVVGWSFALVAYVVALVIAIYLVLSGK